MFQMTNAVVCLFLIAVKCHTVCCNFQLYESFHQVSRAYKYVRPNAEYY